MLYRDMKEVQLTTFTDTVDTYGRFVPDTPTTISMSIYTYQQSSSQDIRFVDVELVGITKAKVKGGDIITCDGKDYRVKWVQESRLRNLAYLTKLGA